MGFGLAQGWGRAESRKPRYLLQHIQPRGMPVSHYCGCFLWTNVGNCWTGPHCSSYYYPCFTEEKPPITSDTQSLNLLSWVFCCMPCHTTLQRICNNRESLGSQTCPSTPKILSLGTRGQGKDLASPLTDNGSVDRVLLRASVTCGS